MVSVIKKVDEFSLIHFLCNICKITIINRVLQ